MPPDARRSRHARLLGLLLSIASGCTSPHVAPGATAADVEAAEPAASQPAESAATSETGSGEDEQAAHDELLDDSGELSEAAPTEAQVVRPHLLDGWNEAQIAAAVEQDLASLGSMSLGSPNAGALINGVQAQATPLYEPVSPGSAWATQETLDFLGIALGKVHEQFTDTRALALGDISDENGGPARPHISHQSGRDVDIAYFYVDGARWYARGTAKNLDLPRNWAFVRALIADTDVDLILIDRSIQGLLEQYALEQGEDATWLGGVFRGAAGRLRPIIRHAPGHATHIHIRFFNPIAQETARRCHALLLQAKLTSTPQNYVTHRVKKNETLGMISRKYKVSVPGLRAANGLKSSLIREKSLLRVPIASRGPARLPERVAVPARRTPPPTTVMPARDAAAAQPPPTR
ncbi:MAG TPA: penicillin-insensitive murein endopeptidase [Polyangiaceae bacterium]|nr:penicillin-insensitive murein endopeptidase [Polyangiaceae bacterium]